MLDIGFRGDIRRILSRFEQPHQTLFVSATISGEIKTLAKQFMREPVELDVSGDRMTVDSVAQYYAPVEAWDKFRMLCTLLKQERPTLMIVFTNTKHGARKLAKRLFAAGVPAKEIHGDLIQQKRERVMERFRRHQIPVLVATDLASRGLDVSAVTHIVNYDIPQDPEVYVHRIGRTARMGAAGKAITFVRREEGDELTRIEQLINKELSRLNVDGFEPSPPPAEFPSAPPPPAAVAVAPPRPVPATLGGRFKPMRRRRL
jgi:ATP-dependent RNA helicase DeaD